MRLPGCNANLHLPDLTIAEASELGAKTLIIGVANRGGRLSELWMPHLREALEAGMDIANGLHDRLADVHELAKLAAYNGRKLFDVRHTSATFDVATGKKRTGKRLLTVGTDCSVGKMYASLAMEQEMKRRGIRASFCATGQTGILIAGGGVSVDAVIADFISGAVEVFEPRSRT